MSDEIGEGPPAIAPCPRCGMHAVLPDFELAAEPARIPSPSPNEPRSVSRAHSALARPRPARCVGCRFPLRPAVTISPAGTTDARWWMLGALSAVVPLSVLIPLVLFTPFSRHPLDQALQLGLASIGPLAGILFWGTVRRTRPIRSRNRQIAAAVLGWLAMPFSLIPVGGMIPAAIAPQMLAANPMRLDAGRCSRCAHSLQGLRPGRACPECGTDHHRGWDPLAAPHSLWFFATVLWLGTGVGAALGSTLPSRIAEPRIPADVMPAVAVIAAVIAASIGAGTFVLRGQFVQRRLWQQAIVCLLGAIGLALATRLL